jgi:hypothetical protein
MKFRSLLVASVFVVAGAASAFAQATFPSAVSAAGVTVTPWPFKKTDNITITVDATRVYPRVISQNGNEPMRGATNCFIHGGVNLGTAGDGPTSKRFQNVPGNWRDYPTKCQFTKPATDRFELKMVPATFYELVAADEITELNFVLNDGTGGKKSGGIAPLATNSGDVNEGRSNFNIPLSGTTSVSNKEIFTAAMTYPNPSTEVANISFGLKNAGNVSLSVVDVQGRTVRTLFTNQTYAGNALNIISWDLTSDAGRAVANGQYFYRLNVGGVVESGAIVVKR